jgi:hypothetical protein
MSVEVVMRVLRAKISRGGGWAWTWDDERRHQSQCLPACPTEEQTSRRRRKKKGVNRYLCVEWGLTTRTRVQFLVWNSLCGQCRGTEICIAQTGVVVGKWTSERVLSRQGSSTGVTHYSVDLMLLFC